MYDILQLNLLKLKSLKRLPKKNLQDNLEEGLEMIATIEIRKQTAQKRARKLLKMGKKKK